MNKSVNHDYTLQAAAWNKANFNYGLKLHLTHDSKELVSNTSPSDTIARRSTGITKDISIGC